MKPPAVLVRWSSVAPTTDTALASHHLARVAAAALLGGDANDLVLSHHCRRCGSHEHGAPSIAGLSVALTLARTRGFVVAAASRDHRVTGLGIDVEVADGAFPGLDAVVLSDAERERSPVSVDGPASLRSWVCKEAILKAVGTGLATDPREITLDGFAVAQGPEGPWSIHDLQLAEGVLGCLAVRGVDIASWSVAEVRYAPQT